TEVDDVAIHDVSEQRGRRFRQLVRQRAHGVELRGRPRLVYAAVERGGPEILPDRRPKRLDLPRRHEALCDAKQDDGNAVIVWSAREGLVGPASRLIRLQPPVDRITAALSSVEGPDSELMRRIRLLSRAQITQHARQIVVTAERA